jgi:hypothetical protein
MLHCHSLSWLPADSLVQAATAPRTSCAAARAVHNLQVLAVLSSPVHAAGTAVFALGSVHQYACHRILRKLRARARTAGSRSSDYGIPRGDWFEKVSCAHYLVRLGRLLSAAAPAIASAQQAAAAGAGGGCYLRWLGHNLLLSHSCGA